MDPHYHIRLTQSFFFRATMWWRIVYGSLRVLVGAMLFKFVGTDIKIWLLPLMEHELINDPTDILVRIGNMLIHDGPLTVTYFLGFYFVFWGLVDIILSINLLRHRLWAYPISLALIFLFVCYSTYRLTHTHSPILAGVILFDGIMLYLIWSEYTNLQKKIQKHATRESGPLTATAQTVPNQD